jgi:hypothetical protein
MSKSEQIHPTTGYHLTHFQWAIEAEAQAQALCMQTEEFHRAFEASSSKKIPKFEGN